MDELCLDKTSKYTEFIIISDNKYISQNLFLLVYSSADFSTSYHFSTTSPLSTSFCNVLSIPSFA